MIYKSFEGLSLSALGLGCMRLPVLSDGSGKIDSALVDKMVDRAIESGINYFDTAWMYHSGESELEIGRSLARYPRESFYLASKFPGFSQKSFDDPAAIFERQLEKCGVDYFDFYLFHNVCEDNIDNYLDPKYGVYDYLMKLKSEGKIRHLGFSAHGAMPVLRRFLEAYGDALEFGQLQINWFDWNYQECREKIDLFSSYGIPVWIMEPVRGGKLASLDEKYSARLRELRPDTSDVEWCFRFLQSLPEVTMVLSGMSNMEQLEDNISFFATEKPTTDAENAVLFDIAREMTASKMLNCTECRYCTEYCPIEIDIPRLISIYNSHVSTGEYTDALDVIVSDGFGKNHRDCIDCHTCEGVCPQHIKITDLMSYLKRKLR